MALQELPHEIVLSIPFKKSLWQLRLVSKGYKELVDTVLMPEDKWMREKMQLKLIAFKKSYTPEQVAYLFTVFQFYWHELYTPTFMRRLYQHASPATLQFILNYFHAWSYVRPDEVYMTGNLTNVKLLCQKGPPLIREWACSDAGEQETCAFMEWITTQQGFEITQDVVNTCFGFENMITGLLENGVIEINVFWHKQVPYCAQGYYVLKWLFAKCPDKFTDRQKYKLFCMAQENDDVALARSAACPKVTEHMYLLFRRACLVGALQICEWMWQTFPVCSLHLMLSPQHADDILRINLMNNRLQFLRQLGHKLHPGGPAALDIVSRLVLALRSASVDMYEYCMLGDTGLISSLDLVEIILTSARDMTDKKFLRLLKKHLHIEEEHRERLFQRAWNWASSFSAIRCEEYSFHYWHYLFTNIEDKSALRLSGLKPLKFWLYLEQHFPTLLFTLTVLTNSHIPRKLRKRWLQQANNPSLVQDLYDTINEPEFELWLRTHYQL